MPDSLNGSGCCRDGSQVRLVTGPVNDLRSQPVHLGLGASALPQPQFSGMVWYEAYAQRADADGAATALFITGGEGTQHRPR